MVAWSSGNHNVPELSLKSESEQKRPEFQK